MTGARDFNIMRSAHFQRNFSNALNAYQPHRFFATKVTWIVVVAIAPNVATQNRRGHDRSQPLRN